MLSVCDQAITPSEDNEGYYLSGAVVKDLNLDRLSITVSLTRNDSIITDADIMVGDDTLTYNSGKYFIIYDVIDDLAVGNHVLKL